MDLKSKVKLHTGREMPRMGIGTWQLENAADIISYALSIGYSMIDTSSDYGTQPSVGEGIKKSKKDRSEIYLVTKVEEKDNAYERVRSNLEELDLEYADLMLIHRPPKNGVGEGLWNDLIKARDDGLVRDIGVSNYSAPQIDKLISLTNEIPTVNQIEWSPFGHDMGMLKHCRQKGIVIQAYSPLTRTKKLDERPLNEIAAKYNKSPAQIVIRWNLQIGTVPIPKAEEKDLVKENIEVFDFELSVHDMERLASLNEEFSSLGALPYV